jgi:hypothetical protein
MPQHGRKFTFLVHSYQSATNGLAPDLTIKIGEFNNRPDDFYYLRRRLALWVELAQSGASLAREYLEYAAWQTSVTEHPQVSELLERYFFLPMSNAKYADARQQNLIRKRLRRILAGLHKLHLFFQSPLEILGTGKYFETAPPLGYVKVPNGVSNRKLHVLLNGERIAMGEGTVDSIMKTLVHEASHKVLNNHDYFYEGALRDTPDVEAGVAAFGKTSPANQAEVLRIKQKAKDQSAHAPGLRMHIEWSRHSSRNADSYAHYVHALADRGTAPVGPGIYQRIYPGTWGRPFDNDMDRLLDSCRDMKAPGKAKFGDLEVVCGE